LFSSSCAGFDRAFHLFAASLPKAEWIFAGGVKPAMTRNRNLNGASTYVWSVRPSHSATCRALPRQTQGPSRLGVIRSRSNRRAKRATRRQGYVSPEKTSQTTRSETRLADCRGNLAERAWSTGVNASSNQYIQGANCAPRPSGRRLRDPDRTNSTEPSWQNGYGNRRRGRAAPGNKDLQP